MNDPSGQQINVEEQREWLLEHKKVTGLSWKQLAGKTGVNHSTLSLFSGNNYNAPGEKIAEAIYRYRQTLVAQASLKGELPEIPGYFETETSQRLIQMLGMAQRGRMGAAAMSPGLGKTMTAEHYKACNSQVFLITADPATKSVIAIIHAFLRELGISHAMYRKSEASQQVVKRVRELGNPLLIVDEAQHLEHDAVEILRAWHDKTGLGVALLGNAGLIQTLEGGSRSVNRAQLFSRISFKLTRLHALQADVEAMLDAWRIQDEELAAVVHAIAMKPGALRGATFALELAHMIAGSAGEDLCARHLNDAWTQLSSRPVAA